MLDQIINEAEPAQRKLVETLVRRIREKGIVPRMGHALWIYHVATTHQQDSAPIPTFQPDPGAPYTLMADEGAIAMKHYIEAKQGARPLLTAAREVEAAAKRGSICAMTMMGSLLLRGDYPGRVADPVEGRHWLERSLGPPLSNSSYITYGEILVEGKLLPQDLPRGLQLIEQAARNGKTDACTDLAITYQMGRYGVPADPAQAHYWLLHVSEFKWRRLLHRAGLKQGAWCTRTIHQIHAVQQKVQSMPPGTLLRKMKRTFKGPIVP